MTTDLNTLLTALHVKIDDHLAGRRRMGRPPKLTDAELVTLAVAQALLGFTSEARWLRFLPLRMPGAFRNLPGQSGYNRRLRAALPRWFWGLRLHLVCTPAGLPVTWALADPKIDERRVLMAICDHEPDLLTERPGLLIIADKGYVSRELDQFLHERGVLLIRPSYRNRTPHPGEPLLKSIRQLIESVNDTLKGQLDLKQHGGRTIEGVAVRIAQRLLALTAAIWHNRATNQPLTRSLTAYDH
ncbi:transposase [Actinophytocola sp. KF-1]